MATSTVSSVLYTNEAATYELTKSGKYVYWGDATSYYEWEFRTRLSILGTKDDFGHDTVVKIVEGLRGDAFVVAQEVGLGELVATDGIDQLVAAMRAIVLPLTTHEAKELFRVYCKTRGPLARQVGENMTPFISGRKRCWKLLKELDPEIELSEGHRADMLLDLAGLEKLNARWHKRRSTSLSGHIGASWAINDGLVGFFGA